MYGLSFIYRDIILEFLFELYVFYALITWKLNRATHFWLKMVVGFVCVLVIALGAAAAYQLCGQTVI